jgi:hypothetical protein
MPPPKGQEEDIFIIPLFPCLFVVGGYQQNSNSSILTRKPNPRHVSRRRNEGDGKISLENLI